MRAHITVGATMRNVLYAAAISILPSLRMHCHPASRLVLPLVMVLCLSAVQAVLGKGCLMPDFCLQ